MAAENPGAKQAKSDKLTKEDYEKHFTNRAKVFRNDVLKHL